MTVEFVVQLDSGPGALAAFARSLAERGVEIRSIVGGGLGRLGYAIVATDDPETTRAALAASGHPWAEGHPVLVELEDRPGVLAGAVQRLADAGIEVSGLTVVGRTGSIVELAITTPEPESARRALGLELAEI